MEWLTEEIARCRQRVARISEHPDPAKLRSNRVLYELELKQREAQLAAVEMGRPPLASGMLFFDALLRALGFEVWDIQGAVDKAMVADEYVSLAASKGFPESACDRTVGMVGMYLANRLPLPNLFVAAYVGLGCDCLYGSTVALAEMYGVPLFCLDVPLEENWDTLQYVTAQLRELIEFVERTVPGAKYDEAKLAELQAMNRTALGYLRDIYQLRKLTPCPLPGADAFRIPRLPASYPDPSYALEYIRAFRDECVERAAAGGLPEEKLRLMWTCSAPFFANPFKVLWKRGVSVPIFQLDVCARFFGLWGHTYGEEEYGRKLSPLEEEARMLFSMGWNRPVKTWIDHVVYIGRDLGIDGVVNFLQVGCTPACLGSLLKQAVEKELGIPVLNIEGRQMLQAYYDKTRFESALDLFVDICLQHKAAQQAGQRQPFSRE